MAVANKLENIHVGAYGQTITLTLQDPDPPHAAVNISSYTTSITIKVRSPEQDKTVSAVGSFNTDGTDGKVDFAFADGDIDRAGKWKGIVILIKAGEEAHTENFEFTAQEEFG